MNEPRVSELAQALLSVHAKAIRAAKTDADAHAHATRVVGGRLASWAFADNREQTPAMEAVAEWHKGDVPILVLHGPHDIGKTVAATRWAGRTRAVFVRASTLGRAPLKRPQQRATNMVIDALTADRNSATAASLLRERSAEGLRTLVTTAIPLGGGAAAGTITSEYPAPVVDMLAAGWISLPPTAPPARDSLTAGIDRAKRIAAALPDCEFAASGVVVGGIGRHAVTLLAEALGVSLGGPVLALAQQYAAARLSMAEEMAAALARNFTTPEQIRTT